MKKFLCILAVLFMGANASATITANLSVYDVAPSTEFPGSYNVILFAGSMTNSCSGLFSFAFLRSQTPNDAASWNYVNAILITTPCPNPSEACSGFYKIYQPDGFKYYYKVRVIFNPESILQNDHCHTDTDEIKTSVSNNSAISVDLSMSACFNILNINSINNNVDSFYGPQSVKNLCGPTVSIDGSCSQNETGYFISLYEFDLLEWEFGTLYYSGWVSGTAQAPSLINLNNLISQNNANTNFTPHTSFDSHKIYIITLSVGSVWHSAPSQFFKVKTCFAGKNASVLDNQIENNNSKEPKFTLYPNPTDGVVTIEKKEKKVVLKAITVYDTNNVVIMTKTLENVNSQEINLTSLRQGIYVINVETDEGVFVDKLVRN